jgi:hypothetical protein
MQLLKVQETDASLMSLCYLQTNSVRTFTFLPKPHTVHPDTYEELSVSILEEERHNVTLFAQKGVSAYSLSHCSMQLFGLKDATEMDCHRQP